MISSYSSHECSETDPRSVQPISIKIPMKPHQLTALHKMTAMENTNKLSYKLPSDKTYDLDTTMGVLTDKVGYGKSIIVLALIASNNTFNTGNDIIKYTKSNPDSNQYIILKTNNTALERNTDRFIKATLLVVPHGPVMMQWESYVRNQTELTVLVLSKKKHLDALPAVGIDNEKEVRDFLSQYDVVIVSGTFYKQFREFYGSREHLNFWKRVVVDEAHSLRTTAAMRPINARFSWFVTATPNDLQYPSSSGYVRQSFYAVNYELMRFISVKSNDEFIKQSFNLPAHQSYRYLCKEVVNMGFVSLFASQHVMSMLNANDFEGAIMALGGKAGEDTDIIKLITKDVTRDIENKLIEIDSTQRMDLPEPQKRARVLKLNKDLDSLREKYSNMKDRLSDLQNKECAVCCSTYENPVSLGCSHVFCAACIFEWIEVKTKLYQVATCPQCKAGIDRTKMFYMGDRSNSVDDLPSSSSSAVPAVPTLNKLQTVLKIIAAKPEGRFIIFSQHYGCFHQIKEELYKQKISNRVLMGQGCSQNQSIQDFKSGAVRALMLNTWHSGAGIDLHMATDIILFQKLDEGQESQVIGRGQRPGRTAPLQVHYLYHQNELDSEEDTSSFIISS